MKTHKEMYQAHTVAMGEALRAASDTLVELSTADLTPGDLVNAIDDIGTMLVIGREHALRMCIYYAFMENDAEYKARYEARGRGCKHELGSMLDGSCAVCGAPNKPDPQVFRRG